MKTIIMASNKLYYAGIGSRQTPPNVESYIFLIAAALDDSGWTLRSGAADGADLAFMSGATNSQVFVPWDNFNGYKMKYPIPDEAYEIAEKYHPSYAMLPRSVQALMARNSMQVLGPDLKTPSAFVVCWTPDGSDGSKTTAKTGGTGQALRIAYDYKIPVYNLADKKYTRFGTYMLENKELFHLI